ncbi:orotidine-5'-phosphate decarboxylase [Deferribacter autotrophicus]|uniref:Orotidine 5'-phosphate decarboxylase n=1 Tax=Deferribacter autotrophicus TaxID=500465 RepID=A0A5A8F7U6_9BACT|nr:orotidine-5'-phosphate decarboxylase [Deferribacter autotrophicus]KAA0258038.1 orotidine-5'-phosphate decarboxylase [Deferribacter autotrophicus]
MKPEIIVALDFADFEQAKSIINKLEDEITYYKVGLEAFVSIGNSIIDYLKNKNKKVFLDLKFHDIPNTVKKASIAAAKLNIDMFNIHIQGGKKMISETVSAVKEINSSVIILGVTLLTSLDKNYFNEFNIKFNNETEYVLHLAKIGKLAGLDGVVSSAKETPIIKNQLGDDFLTVTPGIRLASNDINDQKRVVTPKDAKNMGTDYIVVGRPITQADDPKKAAMIFKEELYG